MLRKCAVFVGLIFSELSLEISVVWKKTKLNELVLKQIISLTFDDFWLTDWLTSGEQMFASNGQKYNTKFLSSFISCLFHI